MLFAARSAASSSPALLNAMRLLLCCSSDVAADRVSGMLVGPALKQRYISVAARSKQRTAQTQRYCKCLHSEDLCEITAEREALSMSCFWAGAVRLVLRVYTFRR